jgi:hypothetical protein
LPLLLELLLLNPEPHALSVSAPARARTPAVSQRLRLCIFLLLGWLCPDPLRGRIGIDRSNYGRPREI